jgi:peptide/nickel transport system substrate-binding protein
LQPSVVRRRRSFSIPVTHVDCPLSITPPQLLQVQKMSSPLDTFREAAGYGTGRRNLMKGMAIGGAMAASGTLLDALSGAHADETKGAVPKRGGTLRIAITGGTASDTLDAHNVLTQPDVYRSIALYDGLVKLTADGKVVNALAESMEVDPKASSWTIRVRSDAKFHDGRQVTAKDVAASFKRIADPKSPTTGAAAISPLDLDAIQYLDSRTLRIPTKMPFATLPDAISSSFIAGIVPTDYDPKKPIGAGPFKFKSITPAQQTAFVRFNDYWDGAPYLDGLIINEQFQNDLSAFNDLQSGQVDAVANAPNHLVRQVENSTSIKALVSYPSEFTPFTMKADAAPFNNPDVRMAMRLLMDRPKYVKITLAGLGEVANDLYGQFDPCFDTSLKRVQDLDKAKFLLKRAGASDLSFDITTADTANGLITMAQIFSQQAKKAGVTARVKQMDPSLFLDNMYTKVAFSQDFFYYCPIMGQAPLSLLPGTFFNETHWADPEYFKLYAEAQGIVDPKKRCDVIHRMQQIEFERGTYIIPAYNCVVDLLAKNVMGLPKAKTGYAMGNFGVAKAWLA